MPTEPDVATVSRDILESIIPLMSQDVESLSTKIQALLEGTHPLLLFALYNEANSLMRAVPPLPPNASSRENREFYMAKTSVEVSNIALLLFASLGRLAVVNQMTTLSKNLSTPE